MAFTDPSKFQIGGYRVKRDAVYVGPNKCFVYVYIYESFYLSRKNLMEIIPCSFSFECISPKAINKRCISFLILPQMHDSRKIV